MKIVKVLTILSFLFAGSALLPALEMAASLAEIEIIRGEQMYLYVKGGIKQGVTKGMVVSIYNPVDGEQDLLVGRGEVFDIYQRLCKVKVVKVNYKISHSGYVVFGAPAVEKIERLKVEMVKRDEEVKSEKERERKERAKRFSIFKYNGGDSLYLMYNARVELSIGQVGVINGSYSGKGSLSGSGEVEVVRLLQNAVLVRLRGGAYINSLDSVVNFIEDKKVQEAAGEEQIAEKENYYITSIKAVTEKGGKLCLTTGSEGRDYEPFPDSIGYIFNDNMMFERAGLVKFINGRVEVFELSGAINPHGVILFTGRKSEYGGCTGYGGPDEDSKVPPVIAMIKEVIVEGNDNFIYARAGNRNKGFKVGLIGYLYADVQLKTKIGKVEVLEVYDKLSKLKVLESDSQITDKGVVFFEVDPRYYIK